MTSNLTTSTLYLTRHSGLPISCDVLSLFFLITCRTLESVAGDHQLGREKSRDLEDGIWTLLIYIAFWIVVNRLFDENIFSRHAVLRTISDKSNFCDFIHLFLLVLSLFNLDLNEMSFFLECRKVLVEGGPKLALPMLEEAKARSQVSAFPLPPLYVFRLLNASMVYSDL